MKIIRFLIIFFAVAVYFSSSLELNAEDKNIRHELQTSNPATYFPTVPELVVYEGENFAGHSIRTNLGYRTLPSELNNKISSAIIVSGKWSFCLDDHFENCIVLIPGYYANLSEMHINDSVS